MDSLSVKNDGLDQASATEGSGVMPGLIDVPQDKKEEKDRGTLASDQIQSPARNRQVSLPLFGKWWDRGSGRRSSILITTSPISLMLHSCLVLALETLLRSLRSSLPRRPRTKSWDLIFQLHMRWVFFQQWTAHLFISTTGRRRRFLHWIESPLQSRPSLLPRKLRTESYNLIFLLRTQWAFFHQ